MINIKKLTKEDVGRWIEYTGGAGEKEQGRLRSWNDDYVFVVYKCDNQWDCFMDFTAASTSPADLVFLSMCCKAQMVNGGVQCEACGSNGL